MSLQSLQDTCIDWLERRVRSGPLPLLGEAGGGSRQLHGFAVEFIEHEESF